MLKELEELWRFRELLFVMVHRELKIRYKNSALGFFWSLLNPLITVLVMSFALGFMRKDIVSSTTAYLLAAYVPFSFFQLGLLDSAQTVLGAMPMIKKIYFPREILPLASVLSNFIHLVLALGVFFVYLVLVYIRSAFTGGGVAETVSPFQVTTLYLPVLLVINFALTAGLCLLISAWNTFFEDVKYIVGVATWLMFFLCPVMYFSEDVANSLTNHAWHGWIFKLMNLNPVFTLSDAYRKVLVAPPKILVNGHLAPPLPLDWRYVGISAITSFGILLYGYHTFNRLKWRFAERP